MFVHKALSDALSTQRFKTAATELVKKAKDETLLAEEFQVSLSKNDHINYVINSLNSSEYIVGLEPKIPKELQLPLFCTKNVEQCRPDLEPELGYQYCPFSTSDRQKKFNLWHGLLLFVGIC